MKTVRTWREEWNARRYSRPWIAKVKENSTSPDFSERVGEFTAPMGEPGDLVVYHPVEGQVYVSGWRDTRKGDPRMCWHLYENEEFRSVRFLGGEWVGVEA